MKQNKRPILHLVGGIDSRGGVNKYVADIVRLPLIGFDQKVWRHRDYPVPGASDVPCGRARFTDLSIARDFIGAARDLRPLIKWIKSTHPCLLHAHSRMGILSSWFARALTNTPVIFSIHAFPSNLSLYNRLIRSSRASVIFNSAQTCRHFGWPVADHHIQPPFIQWPKKPLKNGTTLRFIAASAIVPVKKVDLMLKAFQSFQKIHSASEFHYFGVSPDCPAPGYQREMISLASSITGFTFHDYDPSWTQFLQSTDVFLHIRPDESFGIVMLEAFANGLRMIVPPNSFLREIGNQLLDGVWPLTEISEPAIVHAMEAAAFSLMARNNEHLFNDRMNYSAQFSAESAIERLSKIYVQKSAETSMGAEQNSQRPELYTSQD